MAAEQLVPYNAEAIAPDVARAIEIYEIQLGRVQSGQGGEEVFTEFRLRHGVYGQRDEGSQMIRVKIPYGGLDADQLEILADIGKNFQIVLYILLLGKMFSTTTLILTTLLN